MVVTVPIVAKAKSKRCQLKYRKSGSVIHSQKLNKERRLFIHKLAHHYKAHNFKTKISSCSTAEQLFDTVIHQFQDLSTQEIAKL